MLKYKYFSCIFIFLHCAPQDIETKATELKQCLFKQWSLDTNTVDFIYNKFLPILTTNYIWIIDEFINKSKKLNLQFPLNKQLIQLHPEDGTIKASKNHLIIFENPWIRILYGSTKPGETEDMHIHTCRSLIIIIKPTTFEVIYDNHIKKIESYPIGVYESPAMEKYECKNIGDSADECIRFEIK